jgi:N-formylglutamate deformylase
LCGQIGEDKGVNGAFSLWDIHKGDGAVLATAVHSGHKIRRELIEIIALDEFSRLREEDPYTDFLAKVAPNWIIPSRSRFEVDINRSRELAVYLALNESWGLQIWQQQPDQAMIKRCLVEYDRFYENLEVVLKHLERDYGHFVVLDLHSYNHRRAGPNELPADPLKNPEVNVGTGSMNRNLWGNLVDRFIDELSGYDYLNGHLDVRENVNFLGRQLACWVHSHFPQTGCVLAIEFKKCFMDEWSGILEPDKLNNLYNALKSTLPGLTDELNKL